MSEDSKVQHFQNTDELRRAAWQYVLDNFFEFSRYTLENAEELRHREFGEIALQYYLDKQRVNKG